jgi:hypothetical protein
MDHGVFLGGPMLIYPKRHARPRHVIVTGHLPDVQFRTLTASAPAENDPGMLAKAYPPLHHDGAIAHGKGCEAGRRVPEFYFAPEQEDF